MRRMASPRSHGVILAPILLIGAVFSQTLDFDLCFDDRALFGESVSPSPTPEAPGSPAFPKADTGLHTSASSSLLQPFRTDFWGIATRRDAPANSPYYRPVSALFIVLERSEVGDLASIRAIHTALFILAVCLLFITLLRLAPGVPPVHAAIGCSLFALAPWGPDIVLFLSSVGDLLALDFALVAMIALSLFLETEKGRWLALHSVAALLAMLSKETAYPLPIVSLVLYLHSRRRLTKLKEVGLFMASTLPLLAVLVARAVVLKTGSIAVSDTLVNLPWALGAALRYTLLPYPPVMEVSGNGGPLWAICGGGFSAFILLYLVRSPRRINPLRVAAALWLILLTPALFAAAASHLFAPRYLFAPFIGVALGMTYLLGRLSPRARAVADTASRSADPIRVIRLSARLGLIAVLCLETWIMINRTVSWRDGMTLWSVELGENPTSLTAHLNLGNLLAEQGREQEALAVMLRTIDLADEHHRPCQAAAAALNASNLLISIAPARVRPLLEKQKDRCPRLDPVIRARLDALTQIRRAR